MQDPLRIPEKESDYLARKGAKSRKGVQFQYRGDEVRHLQDALLALGLKLSSQGANGVFDSDTSLAVRTFQKYHNNLFVLEGKANPPLRTGSIVGPKTALALNCALARAGIWFDKFEYEVTGKEGKFQIHCIKGAVARINPTPEKEVRLYVGRTPPMDWNSGKKYYDDLRAVADLKKGSVDDHGLKYGMKQNMFNNYVHDLQNDLRKLRFVEVGKPDGIFGRRTKQAVEALQTETHCVASGVVESKTKKIIKEWLGKGIKRQGIFYEFRLIPQTTRLGCWAASTSMVLSSPRKQAPSPPLSKYPKPSDVSKKIGIPLIEGLDDSLVHTDLPKLATAYGLIIDRRILTIQNLKALLQDHGPLYVSRCNELETKVLKDAKAAAQANLPYDVLWHHSVIVGLRDDGYVLIADPWPLNIGEIRLDEFGQFSAYYNTTIIKHAILYRP